MSSETAWLERTYLVPLSRSLPISPALVLRPPDIYLRLALPTAGLPILPYLQVLLEIGALVPPSPLLPVARPVNFFPGYDPLIFKFRISLTPQVKTHIITEGPLQLMRTQSAAHEHLRPFAAFLEDRLPYKAGRIVLRDPYIPQIIYAVEYDLHDDDFAIYEKMLDFFGLAGELNTMLVEGSVDQLEKQFGKPNGNWTYGWRVPAGADLENFCRELVEKFGLGMGWDQYKPWESPQGRAGPAPR